MTPFIFLFTVIADVKQDMKVVKEEVRLAECLGNIFFLVNY